MEIVVCNLVALTVATFYYAWREGHLRALRRQRLKHQRVANLLWAAAQRA